MKCLDHGRIVILGLLIGSTPLLARAPRIETPPAFSAGELTALPRERD